MQQIPDNRPRPHDRHLDRHLVEIVRPQDRQGSHLGPRFDLEGAHRIGPVEHLIDGLVIEIDAGQFKARLLPVQ